MCWICPSFVVCFKLQKNSYRTRWSVDMVKTWFGRGWTSTRPSTSMWPINRRPSWRFATMSTLASRYCTTSLSYIIRGRHIIRLYHRLVMAPWETALVLISMRSRCCRRLPNVHSHVRMYLERLIQILKAPTQDYSLLVRNCWAVPNFESSSKLQLITEGCMDDDLRRQGLDFEVTDNGHSHKVTFTIPVIKFVE